VPPGVLEHLLDPILSGGGQADPHPAQSLPPQQLLERGRVLGHGGVGFPLADEHVQVLAVRRCCGEDLAAHPERLHVEVRFLGRLRQRQREPPGPLKIAHQPRLLSRPGTPPSYGATLDFVVADSCDDGNAWCKDDPYHVDLAQASLNQFVLNGQPVGNMYPDHWNNRQVSWQFIPAPNYTGDIKIGAIQGAQPYWPLSPSPTCPTGSTACSSRQRHLAERADGLGHGRRLHHRAGGSVTWGMVVNGGNQALSGLSCTIT
jgi:hypothetical protein